MCWFCFQCFLGINSFNHQTSLWSRDYHYSHDREGNWGRERASSLPKVTGPISSSLPPWLLSKSATKSVPSCPVLDLLTSRDLWNVSIKVQMLTTETRKCLHSGISPLATFWQSRMECILSKCCLPLTAMSFASDSFKTLSEASPWELSLGQLTFTFSHHAQSGSADCMRLHSSLLL